MIASAALALAAAAASATPAIPTGAETPPDKIWRSTCGYCHGGPMNAPELRGMGLPPEEIARVVRAGAAGMPPFHPSALSDAELRALTRWIAAQPAPAVPPAPAAPVRR